jgi:group II intron reverse transcriptase/maturase
MPGTPSPTSISPKLQRLAELARTDREMVFTTLAHVIDLDFLREAYRRTRKDGAVGIDGQTAAEFAEDLEGNLAQLLDAFKSGRYRAPAVRRVYIPKGDGRQRPLGIPAFADKVLQRAVAMALEPIYEPVFLDCSHGFRPGRRAHDALQAIWDTVMAMRRGCWVIEADISGFFDHVDHGHLRTVFAQRVRDGVITRTIGKWLKAGVLEDGAIRRSQRGTPQGGVISPLLANIYLHDVLDRWFHDEVLPRLRGQAKLVRYADDFVILFEEESDARRVFDVLPRRFAKYGLELHPDKTRLLRFDPPSRPRSPSDPSPRSFEFLGFCHFWDRSRRGKWIVRKKTAAQRLRRSLRAIHDLCRRMRHLPLRRQRALLTSRMRGHYSYFGVTGNSRALSSFYMGVKRSWRYWLSRRSRASVPWARFHRLFEHWTLPFPIIVHRAPSRSERVV